MSLLYKKDGTYTRYGIHPDGAWEGTEGCIGIIMDDTIKVKKHITDYLWKNRRIKVIVKQK